VEESSRYEPEQLVHLIALCDAAAGRVRSSTVPRAIIDAVVARMALSERFAGAASLLAGESGTKKKRLTAAEAAPRPATPPRSVEPPVARPQPPRPVAAPPVATAKVTSASSAPPKPTPRPNLESVPTTPDADEPTTTPSGDGPWATLQAAAESARERVMLEDFDFERLEGGTLHLRPRPDASPGHAWVMKRPDAIEALASRAFGRRMQVVFVGPALRSVSAEPSASAHAEVADHPLVREAIDLFDAHVVQVRPAATRVESTESTEGEVPVEESD
jgi:hypothetical protein